jgi:hypothetical protein
VRDTASEQEARSVACSAPIGAPMLVCIASNISIRSGWREMDDEAVTGGGAPEPAVLNSGFGMYFYVPVSLLPGCTTVPSAVLCTSSSRVWYPDQGCLSLGCATLQAIMTVWRNQARK